MRIPDKEAFKRLSARGLLGNTFRQWDTPREVQAAGYKGWLTIRAKRAGDKKLFVPAVEAGQLLQTGGPNSDVGLFIGRTFHSLLDAVYLQECPAPDTARIINLEAMPGCDHSPRLYVRYALNDPTNLRHSLEQNGVDAEGLLAWRALQRYLQDDLEALRDIWAVYPDAVIEASRFSRACGTQNNKLIIWEVRNY